MDLNDIQKIWDESSQSVLYTINEKAMERIINKKIIKADRWADRSEKAMILINTLCPLIVLLFSLLKQKHEWSVYLLVAFMLCSALYIFIKRKQRIKSNLNWESTILGSLNRAINDAKYLSNLAKGMHIWYLLGISSISIFGVIADGRSVYIVSLFILFFVATAYLVKWERRIFYDRQYKELVSLREKLLK